MANQVLGSFRFTSLNPTPGDSMVVEALEPDGQPESTARARCVHQLRPGREPLRAGSGVETARLPGGPETGGHQGAGCSSEQNEQLCVPS
jgi:hypothetical protein